MTGVVRIGSNQHKGDFLGRNGQTLLPAVLSEIQVEMLDEGMGTTMTSKAWVRLW